MRFSKRTRVKVAGEMAGTKPRKKAATHCQPVPFFARWEHSLKRLKSQHGLALRLCKPRRPPCTSGMTLVPSRTQHRLASVEAGGTCLSRCCDTAQSKGGYGSGWLNCILLLNHASRGMVQILWHLGNRSFRRAGGISPLFSTGNCI